VVRKKAPSFNSCLRRFSFIRIVIYHYYYCYYHQHYYYYYYYYYYLLLLLLPPPLLLWSRDGVDGIQTHYKLGGSAFEPHGECKRLFRSAHEFRPVLGFLSWIKRPGCGVDQPPQ